jgi:uncharacterized protein (TIGR03067 family)
MRVRVLLALAAAWLVAAERADRVKEELKRLEGTWTPVSGAYSGKKLSAADLKREGRLIIKGGRFTLENPEDKAWKGTVTVNPAKKPKTLDLKITDGEDKGQTFEGIYELKWDTLKVYYSTNLEIGDDRPTSFDSSSKGWMLVVFKRGKTSK